MGVAQLCCIMQLGIFLVSVWGSHSFFCKARIVHLRDYCYQSLEFEPTSLASVSPRFASSAPGTLLFVPAFGICGPLHVFLSLFSSFGSEYK